jgi:uncharacterized protein YcaQ
MLPPPLPVTPAAARRFARRALLLDAPAPDVASALDHHGFIQIDPINVCGRMHDLILRNRVAGYAEGGLHAHLYQPGRAAFEHYLPGYGILGAFPAAAWPYLAHHTQSRRTTSGGYGGKLSAAENRLAERILGEIGARGPLTSGDIEDSAQARTAWGSCGRSVKIVLEKLFFHGRVLITSRRAFRRVYDLPERVLPAAIRSVPVPSPDETHRWFAQLKLRQRRLAFLKKAELPWVADLVQPVRIEGLPTAYCLRSDVPLLAEAAEPGAPFGPPHLLAPLDPLIYDRRLTHGLWGFDYTWEVYTPAAKRRRGYYALPVLSGTELVGHVDLKADRASRRLTTVSRLTRRGHLATPAIRELAKFLGLRR